MLTIQAQQEINGFMQAINQLAAGNVQYNNIQVAAIRSLLEQNAQLYANLKIPYGANSFWSLVFVLVVSMLGELMKGMRPTSPSAYLSTLYLIQTVGMLMVASLGYTILRRRIPSDMLIITDVTQVDVNTILIQRGDVEGKLKTLQERLKEENHKLNSAATAEMLDQFVPAAVLLASGFIGMPNLPLSSKVVARVITSYLATEAPRVITRFTLFRRLNETGSVAKRKIADVRAQMLHEARQLCEGNPPQPRGVPQGPRR